MTRAGIRWDRRVEAALALLAGVVYGSWREFMFINLNYQIDHVARHTEFSYAHSMVQGWVGSWDLRALLVLKWSLAFFSMAVIAGLCVLLLRVLAGSWRHARWIFAAFAAFALLSLSLQLLSPWVPPFGTIAIALSHMLQYPVPLVFVLVAGQLGVKGEGMPPGSCASDKGPVPG